MNAHTSTKLAAAIFAATILLALATRVDLALTRRSCLNGDEAVVGVLAYRIEDSAERQLFPFGNFYGGGQIAKANIAAALDTLFGRSLLNIQLPEIIFFSLFAALSALLAARALGPLPGALLGLHIIFSPVFFRQSLRPTGYMETLSLMVLCAYIVHSRITRSSPVGDRGAPPASPGGEFGDMTEIRPLISDRVPEIPGQQNLSERYWESPRFFPPPSIQWGALMGLLTGVALWWLEFSAPLTAALFAAAALKWKKKAIPALAAWIAVFPIGAAAVVYVNISSRFVNLRHLAAGHFAYFAQHRTLLDFFTKELPSFFQNDNTDWFAPSIPWTAWLLFAVTITGCLIALSQLITARRKTPGATLLAFAFSFIALYSLVYNISPFRGESARYILPLEPFLSLGLVAGISLLIGSRKPAAYILAAALISGATVSDFHATRFALSDTLINDSTEPDISCSEIHDMSAMLSARRVSHVFTGDFLKWIIAFESQDKIKAADLGVTRGSRKWTDYETAVTNSPNPAYLFNTRDHKLPWLELYLRAHRISYKKSATASWRYTLIQPASRVSQFDFLAWSRAAYKQKEKTR